MKLLSHRGFRRATARVMLPVYMAAIVYLTLIWKSQPFTGAYRPNVNVVPFFWILEPILEGEAFSAGHVVLNFLFFMPLGFLLPAACGAENADVSRVALAGLIVSLSIELLQPFVGRCTDIDDLAVNALGTIAGYRTYLTCKTNLWLAAPTLRYES